MSFLSRHLAIASLCLTVVLPASAEGLTVTALDHSGFMFSDGKTKILVDALIEPSQWPYHAPAPDLLAKMEKGEAPFDGITLLLISHDHTDHYSPDATIRFLQSHPKTVAVTTAEVRERLKKIAGFDAVAARIVAPDLAWKQALTQTFNGISLEIDRLKHGDDGKWACQLDAFVFTLGGKKVLYATATGGFFPEEYTELGYARRGLDLAFVNYYLAIKKAKGETPASLNDGGVAQLKNMIAAKTTVLMHIEGEAGKSVDAMMPALQAQLPGVTVFKSELESRIY